MARLGKRADALLNTYCVQYAITDAALIMDGLKHIRYAGPACVVMAYYMAAGLIKLH